LLVAACSHEHLDIRGISNAGCRGSLGFKVDRGPWSAMSQWSLATRCLGTWEIEESRDLGGLSDMVHCGRYGDLPGLQGDDVSICLLPPCDSVPRYPGTLVPICWESLDDMDHGQIGALISIEQGTRGPIGRGTMGRGRLGARLSGFRWTLVPSWVVVKIHGDRETLAARGRLNEGPWSVR